MADRRLLVLFIQNERDREREVESHALFLA